MRPTPYHWATSPPDLLLYVCFLCFCIPIINTLYPCKVFFGNAFWHIQIICTHSTFDKAEYRQASFNYSHEIQNEDDIDQNSLMCVFVYVCVCVWLFGCVCFCVRVCMSVCSRASPRVRACVCEDVNYVYFKFLCMYIMFLHACEGLRVYSCVCTCAHLYILCFSVYKYYYVSVYDF